MKRAMKGKTTFADLPPDIQRIWKPALDAGVPLDIVLARAQELDRDAEATFQALLVAFAEKDALEAASGGENAVDPFDPDQRRMLTGRRGDRMAKKVVAKRMAFGGYTVCFKGCTDTLESIMGNKPVSPSEMTKRLWAYVKHKRLAGKHMIAGDPAKLVRLG